LGFIKNKSENATFHWEGQFTGGDVGCFPVSEQFEEHKKGKEHKEHTEFYNIVVGIADPSVFEPPKDCKHQKSN